MRQNKVIPVFSIAVSVLCVLFINKNYVSYFRECVGNDLRVIKYLFPVGIALFGMCMALSYLIAFKRKKSKDKSGLTLFFAGAFLLAVGGITSYFIHSIAPVLLIQTAVLIASYVNCICNFLALSFFGCALGEKIKNISNGTLCAGAALGSLLAMIADFVSMYFGTEVIFVSLGIITVIVSIFDIAANSRNAGKMMLCKKH